MKTRRIIALLLALVMICGVFAACGKKEEPAPATNNEQKQEEKKEEKKDYKDYNLDDWYAEYDAMKAAGKTKFKYLYMPSWAASEYFVNSYDEWNKIFQAEGWELDFIGPKEYTGESQLGVLEAALVSQEYDGVILYPIDPATFVSVRDENWETYHCPIIVWGFAETLAGGAGDYYMQPGDNQAINGQYQAQAIIKYVDDNMDYFKKYDGQGIPTIAVQQSANPNQNVRVLTSMETLEKDGRFKFVLVEEQVSDSKAMEFAESWIMNHGAETEICVMYNDPLCVSYINAVRGDTSTKFSDHLAFFGIDGTKAIAKMLQSEGDKALIKGSVLSSHNKVGQLLRDGFKVATIAAQHEIIADGLTEKLSKDFLDDAVYGPNRFSLNSENVWDFYPTDLNE